MSITLIVGDIHLGKGLVLGRPGIGNALNSRIVDQINLLDWIVEQAIDNNADSIIFTGDIFQYVKPEITLIEIFFKFLKKCEVYGIEVHIVAGNHDIKRTGSNYSSVLDTIVAAELPMTHVYKNTHTIYRDGVGFTLLPFRDRISLGCDSNLKAIKILADQLPYELEDIPNGWDKVLVGHLSLEGSMFVGDEVDNLANELMCPLDMFAGYDYVWMGHVHKPQVCSANPYIAHIGSLDISDYGETDHNKILVLFNTNSSNRVKEIQVPTRPLRKIVLEVPKDINPTSWVIGKINDEDKQKSLKKAIVKIEINLLDADAESINRKLIETAVYDLGAYYISNLSESRSVSVVPISKQQNIDNTIEPKVAVKLYAEQVGFNKGDNSLFVSISNDVIDKYKEMLNK